MWSSQHDQIQISNSLKWPAQRIERNTWKYYTNYTMHGFKAVCIYSRLREGIVFLFPILGLWERCSTPGGFVESFAFGGGAPEELL